MPYMRSTLLLAAAMLAAAPAAAQQHAASQTPAVEIDPCTGKPVEADGAGTQAASGATTSAASGTATHAHPAGPHAGTAHGTAPASGSAASSATSTSAASSASPGGQGMTPSGATASSASPVTAASSTSASGPGMMSATSASGSAVSPSGTPGTAASSTSAGGQGMMSATSASGSAVSPSGTPGTAASSTYAGGEGMTSAASDTTDPVDPRNAARNRKAMALGMGRLGDQVRLGPAASVSVPTALGVDAGEVFFGVAYQGRTRYTRQDDAAAVAGFGIGTRRVLALEVALTTYSTFRGAPLETGGVSFKLHRVLPGHSSIAVGYENALLWGGSDDDGSLYAVASRQLNLRDDPGAPFSTAVATLGVGNGRFRFEEDYATDRETVNLFAALGVRVTGPLSLVADWTGQDLNAAASLTPIPRLPLVVTAGLADITGSAGDGVRPILSLGYGLALRQPF